MSERRYYADGIGGIVPGYLTAQDVAELIPQFDEVEQLGRGRLALWTHGKDWPGRIAAIYLYPLDEAAA